MSVMMTVAETGDPVRVQYIGVIVSTFIPIVVGIVTKAVTNAGLKAIVLAFLTGLTAFLTEWAKAGDDFKTSTALLTWAVGWAIAVATHYGFWKPTGITAKAQSIGNR